MPITIRRKAPPAGPVEQPHLTETGYKLVDPNNRPKNLAKFQVYTHSLEEAARMVTEKGFSIWMKQAGKSATLISADALVVRF
jgi:hypothetical protein